MTLRFWRRPQPQWGLRPTAAIAILEYDLYGVQPEPGTTAAAIVGLRMLSANHRPGPLDLVEQEAS